jgi:hypothetical protein
MMAKAKKIYSGKEVYYVLPEEKQIYHHRASSIFMNPGSLQPGTGCSDMGCQGKRAMTINRKLFR